MVRERMALPEDAVLSVWIEDISKADAPAELISKATMLLKGRQGTFNFVIPYRVKDISKSNSYSVRATIEHNGKLMFTSTSSNPVITKGSKKSASFTLERVGDHSNVALSAFGNEWTLKEMNGKALGEKDSKVSLTLNEGDKNCNGRSFVNGYGGSIVFSGSGQAGSIKMGSIMSTKMAGSSESMKHETEYFSTLNKVDSFVIHGSELHLKSGSKVVLKFVTGK
jgi:putative lipoprotein